MDQNTLLSAYEKQLNGVRGKTDILTVVDSRLNSTSFDLQRLDDKSSRAAACLRSCGCKKGDRVLISLRGTVPLWSFFWGALKLGAVPCVLFPGLGAGGLEVRLKAAEADFFITDIDPEKTLKFINIPETLKKIVLVGKEPSGPLHLKWNEDNWQPVRENAEIKPEDDAFIVFTSGTTGIPKPVIHCHGIADAIVRSMKNVLHALPDDIYWCTAHPAWITGTVYGIIGPVLCGIPSIQYEGNFHAKRWMPILQDKKVSLWYTAPTALRALMREDDAFFKDFDFSALKQIYSIGEPLGAAVYHWGEKTFSQPLYDTWFQTECGTIRIANQPGKKIIPGWMGKAVDDSEIILADSHKLCLKAGFSSMFKGYYNMPEAAEEKINHGIYETGDLALIDDEGYLHFEGREDDVINTSGHLVGPAEVEQVLCMDPAVTDAAVTAAPDELCFEVPAAFLVLADGVEWSHQLELKLKAAINNGVSSYAVPKYFYIISELPQTDSGKINRNTLRDRISGLTNN